MQVGSVSGTFGISKCTAGTGWGESAIFRATPFDALLALKGNYNLSHNRMSMNIPYLSHCEWYKYAAYFFSVFCSAIGRVCVCVRHYFFCGMQLKSCKPHLQ